MTVSFAPTRSSGWARSYLGRRGEKLIVIMCNYPCVYAHLDLSFSLSLYKYIFIESDREERERERVISMRPYGQFFIFSSLKILISHILLFFFFLFFSFSFSRLFSLPSTVLLCHSFFYSIIFSPFFFLSPPQKNYISNLAPTSNSGKENVCSFKYQILYYWEKR